LNEVQHEIFGEKKGFLPKLNWKINRIRGGANIKRNNYSKSKIDSKKRRSKNEKR